MKQHGAILKVEDQLDQLIRKCPMCALPPEQVGPLAALIDDRDIRDMHESRFHIIDANLDTFACSECIATVHVYVTCVAIAKRQRTAQYSVPEA